MTAREFLELTGEYKRERDRLERKLVDWRQRAATPSGVNLSEQMAGRGASKDLSDYVARLEELERDWIHGSRALMSNKKMALEMIFAMDDEREQALLYSRYLLLHSWKKIARELGFRNERSAYLLHNKALHHFEELHACFLASL